MSYVYAQIGNERAQRVLDNSLQLTRNTSESWERLWDITVAPGEPLWQAMILLGSFLGAMSLIYLLIKESSVRSLSMYRVIDLVKFPLAIAVMLAGNGYYLAGLIRAMRYISLYWLTRILEMTFAGVTISEAIGKIQNTSVANGRAREIFSECIDKSGVALEECVGDPQKIARAEELLQSLSGSTEPLNGSFLEQIANGVVENLVGAINIPFINSLQFFLNILQWGFMNLVEAALLLTALFGPIALGLSIIPAAAPSIIKWFAGYFSLLLMPLGYILIVGFTANVLDLTEKAGQPLGSSFVDTAFLLFLSVLSPILAIAISKGIGDGIFEGLSRGMKATADAGIAAASGGANLALKLAAKNTRG